MLTVQAGTPSTGTPSSQASDTLAAGHEAAAPEAKEAKKGEPKQPDAEAGISGAPQAAQPKVVSKEETIEYRDQDGNLLNEEQVAALEGKVKFETKYETRTRVIDEAGNEIHEGVAPPHPDVEGVDHETVKKAEGEDAPPPPPPAPPAQDAAASQEGEKEAEQEQAKPASEGKEATGHEEAAGHDEATGHDEL